MSDKKILNKKIRKLMDAKSDRAFDLIEEMFDKAAQELDERQVREQKEVIQLIQEDIEPLMTAPTDSDTENLSDTVEEENVDVMLTLAKDYTENCLEKFLKKMNRADLMLKLELSNAATKFQKMQPLSIFFPTRDVKVQTSINLKELLSDQFGILEEALLINTDFAFSWLIQQFPDEFRKRITIVGSKVDKDKDNKKIDLMAEESVVFPQFFVNNLGMRRRCENKCTNCKVILLRYKEGMRLAVTSARFIPEDWNEQRNWLYISPMLPIMDKAPECENKNDLLSLISYLGIEAFEWMDFIGKADFALIKPRFILSLPGTFKTEDMLLGSDKLKMLINLVPGAPDDRPVVAVVSHLELPCSAHSEKIIVLEEKARGTVKDGAQEILMNFTSTRTTDKYPGSGSIHFKPSSDMKRVRFFTLTSCDLTNDCWGIQVAEGRIKMKTYEVGLFFDPREYGLNFVEIATTLEDVESSTQPKFYLPFIL